MSGPKVIYQVRSAGKAGPELRVVGLWVIAREQVWKASDYVRKQGKVRENEWQGFQVQSGCKAGVERVRTRYIQPGNR